MTRTCALAEEEATKVLARRLAAILRPGDIILLFGDLGAGKTTFTKALASNMGVDEREVTSPSFALIHEHKGRLPLIHADLYRLGLNADITEIGLEDYFYGERVVVIEWAENLGASAPSEALEVELRLTADDSREAILRPRGESWSRRLAELDTSGLDQEGESA